MVQLTFTVRIEKDLETVWNYFSDFSNIAQWDPNTRACLLVKSAPEKVGSEYKVTTVFNGNESEVKYVAREFRRTPTEGYASFWGENDMITAFDEIICRQKGPQVTEMEYRADICLRGIKVLFTPFILCSLKEITETARTGCRDKAIEMWGKAE
jgi:hypothetical protein